MKFDREIIEYRTGIAVLWMTAFLLLVVLAVFHFVAVSFLVPAWYELDPVSRGLAFAFIGSFCVWVDIMSFRYVKGRMERSRWTAEIAREHESRNS